jgi:hypothetical protein
MSFALKTKLRERSKLEKIRMVIMIFPIETIEIAPSYNEHVNEDYKGLTNILIKEDEEFYQLNHCR